MTVVHAFCAINNTYIFSFVLDQCNLPFCITDFIQYMLSLKLRIHQKIMREFI